MEIVSWRCGWNMFCHFVWSSWHAIFSSRLCSVRKLLDLGYTRQVSSLNLYQVSSPGPRTIHVGYGEMPLWLWRISNRCNRCPEPLALWKNHGQARREPWPMQPRKKYDIKLCGGVKGAEWRNCIIWFFHDVFPYMTTSENAGATNRLFSIHSDLKESKLSILHPKELNKLLGSSSGIIWDDMNLYAYIFLYIYIYMFSNTYIYISTYISIYTLGS